MSGGIWTTATTTTIASPRGSRHLLSWRMSSSMARPGFWRECPCRRSRPGLASWSWRFAPGFGTVLYASLPVALQLSSRFSFPPHYQATHLTPDLRSSTRRPRVRFTCACAPPWLMAVMPKNCRASSLHMFSVTTFSGPYCIGLARKKAKRGQNSVVLSIQQHSLR